MPAPVPKEHLAKVLTVLRLLDERCAEGTIKERGLTLVQIAKLQALSVVQASSAVQELRRQGAVVFGQDQGQLLPEEETGYLLAQKPSPVARFKQNPKGN